jgi:hypothetical protein
VAPIELGQAGSRENIEEDVGDGYGIGLALPAFALNPNLPPMYEEVGDIGLSRLGGPLGSFVGGSEEEFSGYTRYGQQAMFAVGETQDEVVDEVVQPPEYERDYNSWDTDEISID